MESAKLKVLVVENSNLLAKMVKKQLTQIGFEEENVHTADDGNKAYLLLGIMQFDLVISSIHLKVRSGIELLKMIRENQSTGINQLPVVFITSEIKDHLFKQLNGLNTQGFLLKPFKPADMESALQKIFLENEKAQPSDEVTSIKNNAPESKVPKVSSPLMDVFSQSGIEAFNQYMVPAAADQPIDNNCLFGDFTASITILNPDFDIRITFVLFFPHQIACDIYDTIFGFVDEKEVGGIVQELANILAGNIKPSLVPFYKEILQLIHPDKTFAGNIGSHINLQIGFPTLIIKDGNSLKVEDNAPRFVIPFKVRDQEINMLVVFEKDSVETVIH